MTENPFSDKISIVESYQHDAWNEGFNQAIEDVLRAMDKEYHVVAEETVEALRKKVDP